MITYNIGFLNSQKQQDETQVDIEDNTTEKEIIELVNLILSLKNELDIQEIIYIDYVKRDEQKTNNKNVYVVVATIVTEDESLCRVEVCHDLDTAKSTFEQMVNEEKDFWEDFDTIQHDNDYFLAYDKDWFMTNHIEIEILKEEVI